MWGIPLDPRPEKIDDEEVDDDTHGESTKAGANMFEKMEDVELVLRFFAYRKIGEFKTGVNKIFELLDRFIVEGNKFSLENLNLYRSMFERTINFLLDTLDCEAFTTNLEPAKRRPTKIIYDPLMFVASGSDVKTHRVNLIKNKAVLRAELKAMYGKNPSLFSGRSANFKDTQDRNCLMTKTFANAIAKIKK
ncbi:MAG: hypothetical protein LBT86_05090 [Deltaproteobacteria bacterium]|jgi:hypothetical protein|nr:hypothetical protein [Deltaproteobacteria bacterium]